MVHHVLTFTEAEDFAQAVAKFALLKGVNLQSAINSTTATMRVFTEAETDQAILEAFVEECTQSFDFDLSLEETKAPAEMLDEINSLRKENAKLQNELNNLQKCKDLYESVYISTNKELERYKAAVSLVREQLNLIFPQKQ